MGKVNVLVLRAAGINCDEEIMHCWRLAGAVPRLVHINELATHPELLDETDIVTIPGGFSFGDDIAAGTILGQRILSSFAANLRALVERGGGILGVCNGFQTLVKAGLLPGGPRSRSQLTVTFNDSARFEARWVRLEVCTSRCPFLTPGTILELPVEHAEGRVVVESAGVAQELMRDGFVALRYVDLAGRSDVYPANPNGSVLGSAGLCDATGRIFGLMPHPDRHFDHCQHPQWTRRTTSAPPDGLTVFQNAVRYWSNEPARVSEPAAALK